jgi:hypothetical protein
VDIEQGIIEYQKKLSTFKMGKYKYPFRILCQKRSFHAFCLGTPKSGTHLIANMFKEFRSLHEPNEIFFINLIHRQIMGDISKEELVEVLKSRDITNWLEMESSHYLGMFAEELLNISENTKFILTIRDCLSWMDSWFNHQLSRPTLTGNSIYNLGRNNYYSRGHEYTKHDKFLEDMKLFPIRSYLEFWNAHNQNVINSVSEKNLLILKTHEISKSSAKLSSFLNINSSQINTESSHEFKAKEKHNILKRLDVNFLYDTAMELCGDLNDKYFPEKKLSNSFRNNMLDIEVLQDKITS